jgi:hypothetical protein
MWPSASVNISLLGVNIILEPDMEISEIKSKTDERVYWSLIYEITLLFWFSYGYNTDILITLFSVGFEIRYYLRTSYMFSNVLSYNWLFSYFPLVNT